MAENSNSQDGDLARILQAITSVAVIGTDRRGLITLFNRGAEILLGYRAQDVTGRMLAERLHMAEEVQARKRQMRQLLKRPVEFGDLAIRTDERGLPEATEWTMVRRDGTHFAGSLSVSPTMDEQGCILGYVGIIEDVSQRVEQARRLEKALRAAEAASRAKSEFLAAMSHEIRTPMNGILGMAGLLMNSDLTTRQRGRMETLRDSAEALLGVLNDILDFSKIEASKLELEVADFDLRRIVEDVCELLAVRAQEKGLEVLYFIEPGVPTRLQGDPNRLRQILINLMGNAVKFTAAGSVALEVSRSEGSGDLLRFEVQDTGPGIPANKHNLLFQPFSQTDASTARRHGGTGLGLSIVAGLVKMLGGQVGFESDEGKGTMFWFTAALPAQPEVRRPKALSLQGKRVLIVDSSAASRAHILRYLRYWDCRGDEAPDRAGALKRLSEMDSGYDAVLVDVGNREMSGEGFPHHFPMPLIAMTALKDARDTAWWQQRGFTRRVTKPLRQGDLGAALAFAMGFGRQQNAEWAATSPAPVQKALRRGRKLLLVEDNAVNREVALGILEDLGYEADVAFDGKAALQLLHTNCYAAVLTDCNLPELDGYELARLIRSRETQVADHDVPVIAMTAHALAGDREKCLQAGMDDYISKPVQAKVLEALLDQYTGVSGKVPDPVAAEEESLSPRTDGFDRDDFVERLMGNEDLAKRVASRFLDDVPAQIAALAQALESGPALEAGQVRDLAHAIKGAAANVSVTHLSRVAREIERAAGEGNEAEIQRCFSQLTAEFDRTQNQLREFIESP